MSRSVDLFIDAKPPLEELAAAMREQLELSLSPDLERRRWVLRDGDVSVYLHEHPYVDDVNLPFSRYRYALSARVANNGRPQDSAEAAVLRRLAQRIHQGPGWPVLLVLDLQFCDAAAPARTAPAGEGGDEPAGSTGPDAAPAGGTAGSVAGPAGGSAEGLDGPVPAPATGA